MPADKVTVMLVDDERDILQSVKKGLEEAGLKVHGYSASMDASEHIENGCNECQMVISDIRMPNINGFQLVRRIRELRPDMKIMLISAFEVNMPEFNSVFPSTHVDRVMKKPLLPSVLAQKIKEIMTVSS